MTPEERQVEKAERDAAICAYYQEGHTMAACVARFHLSRQRVIQILKKAGVWRPYVKSVRTKFLGISVTEEAKRELRQRAARRGVSVSKLVSDVVDAAIAKGK